MVIQAGVAGRVLNAANAELEDPQVSAHAVVLSPQVLGRAFPGYVPGTAIEGRLGTPPVDPRRLFEDGEMIREGSIPEGARFYAREGGAEFAPIDRPAVADNVALRVPFDAEYCRSYGDPVPWGGPLELHAPKLQWLSDGRVLVRDRDGLTVVGPETTGVTVNAIGARRYTSLRVLDGDRVLAADCSDVRNYGICDPEGSFRLIEVGLEPEPHVVRELATLSGKVTDMGVVDGTVYLFQEDGKLLRWDGLEAHLHSEIPIPTTISTPIVTDGIATGDPEYPFAATTPGWVHVYDAKSSIWLSQEPMQGVAATVVFSDIVAHPGSGGLHVTAVGRNGAVVSGRLGAELSSITLQYPPKLQDCTVNLERSRKDLTFATTDGERMFTVLEECDTVAEVRLEDFCVSTLGPRRALVAPIGPIGVLAGTRGLLIAGPTGLSLAQER